MKKTKFLALLLVLAMMVGLFGISAYATDVTVTMYKNTRDITNSTGTTIGSVSVSGMSTTGVSDASWTSTNEATIIVGLIPSTTPASGTLSISISHTGGASNSRNISVTNGEAGLDESNPITLTVDNVIYTIKVQSTEGSAYPTANTGNNYVGIVEGEGVSIGSFSGDGSDSDPYAATVTGPASGYPFTISLRIVPEVSSFNSLTSYSYTMPDVENADAELRNFVGTYFLATYSANSTVLNFSVTAGQNTEYYAITLNATTGTNGSGIVSYLPAPGQFVNEGIATGGWGEIHTSGSANLKALRGAYSATGVSLGAFGGSVVFDFGSTGISNTATNKYGVDFVIYGNAFSTNAEPGCVQVAPDDDNDGIPDKWYDIAGSLYYSGETVDMYYMNPTPSDNTNNTSTLAAVPYTTSVSFNGNTQTWSNSGSMTTNTFHNHSWFPLARNYFDGVDRTATKYTGTGVSGDMANVSDLNPESGSNPIAVMEGQTVVIDNTSTVTTVMRFSGRKISWLGGGAGNYTFGYADVHANGNSSDYSKASNPYAATKDTTGGDGIDIAWAVNADGTPAGLTKIRYVRVYTGVQQVTNFGEVSTEVCGVYKASTSGTGAPTTTTNSVYISEGPTTVGSNPSGAVQVAAGSYKIQSNATYLYVNGATFTSGNTVSVSAGHPVQIISQTGTESPRVIVLYV